LQDGTESSQRAGGIVLVAVEAPINDGLHAVTQRLEERRNDQGRDDDDDRLRSLPTDESKQAFQPNNQAQIHRRQEQRKPTIDQRLVDNRINIPQPVAQDRNAKAQWSEQ